MTILGKAAAALPTYTERHAIPAACCCRLIDGLPETYILLLHNTQTSPTLNIAYSQGFLTTFVRINLKFV